MTTKTFIAITLIKGLLIAGIGMAFLAVIFKVLLIIFTL